MAREEKNGELSGTSGKKLRLEAIKINLSGDVSRYYDVYYRVHIQDKGWLNWAANGAPSGSQSASKRLEAIQIKIVRKGEAAPKGCWKSFLVGDEARTPAEIANRLRAERLKKNLIIILNVTHNGLILISETIPLAQQDVFQQVYL